MQRFGIAPNAGPKASRTFDHAMLAAPESAVCLGSSTGRVSCAPGEAEPFRMLSGIIAEGAPPSPGTVR
jgi:hypothetical protein